MNKTIYKQLIKERSIFGLKNIQEVSGRYDGKLNKFNDIIKQYNTLYLKENIECLMQEKYLALNVHMELLETSFKSGKGVKTALNQLKTFINQITWAYNTGLFYDAPITMKSKYATKLYLAHYTDINNEMSLVFKEYAMMAITKI